MGKTTKDAEKLLQNETVENLCELLYNDDLHPNKDKLLTTLIATTKHQIWKARLTCVIDNKAFALDKLMKDVNKASLEMEISDDSSREITQHLSLLTAELQHYFPYTRSCPCITDPFSVDPADLPVGTGKQEELIACRRIRQQKKQRKECSAINF
ncbi:unnamed protein product [Clavelina lepadiformis]|uniref:Uncharacterized protein n=1 Tax=Clavelina lepadiformis TaxID=159417 RepID=A0ABP0GFZ4_CLALP